MMLAGAYMSMATCACIKIWFLGWLCMMVDVECRGGGHQSFLSQGAARIFNHSGFMMQSQFLRQPRLYSDDLGIFKQRYSYLPIVSVYFVYSSNLFCYWHLTCAQRSRKKSFTDRTIETLYMALLRLGSSLGARAHLSKHIKISSRAERIDSSQLWMWECSSMNSAYVKGLTETNGINFTVLFTHTDLWMYTELYNYVAVSSIFYFVFTVPFKNI